MYGLFPCVPVPLCSVGAGRAADPCSREWGPGGTGECSWVREGRVVREGGVPHRAWSEHGFAARCWSSGRWVGASRGRGRGGRSARVPAEGGPQWACAGHASWLVGRWRAGPGRRRQAGVGQGAALRRPRALSARQPCDWRGMRRGAVWGGADAEGGLGRAAAQDRAGVQRWDVQGHSVGLCQGTGAQHRAVSGHSMWPHSGGRRQGEHGTALKRCAVVRWSVGGAPERHSAWGAPEHICT